MNASQKVELEAKASEHYARMLATVSKDITLCVFGCNFLYWAAKIALAIIEM